MELDEHVGEVRRPGWLRFVGLLVVLGLLAPIVIGTISIVLRALT